MNPAMIIQNAFEEGGGTPSIGSAPPYVRGTTYMNLDPICKKALSILAQKIFQDKFPEGWGIDYIQHFEYIGLAPTTCCLSNVK